MRTSDSQWRGLRGLASRLARPPLGERAHPPPGTAYATHPRRWTPRLLLATLLGAGAAVLVSCGSSGAGLIPAENAGPLLHDFQAVEVAAKAGDGSCSATEAALRTTEHNFQALPATVDAGLHGRLAEGIAQLHTTALELCAQTSTQAITTGATTSTTTTAAPPSATTTTAKTPTAPTSTTPPATATTETGVEPSATTTQPPSTEGGTAPGTAPGAEERAEEGAAGNAQGGASAGGGTGIGSGSGSGSGGQ